MSELSPKQELERWECESVPGGGAKERVAESPTLMHAIGCAVGPHMDELVTAGGGKRQVEVEVTWRGKTALIGAEIFFQRGDDIPLGMGIHVNSCKPKAA